jgi:hypothetical protein
VRDYLSNQKGLTNCTNGEEEFTACAKIRRNGNPWALVQVQKKKNKSEKIGITGD